VPYIDTRDPQWLVNSTLGWGWWKLLDAIFSYITTSGNGNDSDLGSLLGGASGAGVSPATLAPYLAAAKELGLTPDDIAVGLASLQAPDSALRVALADVLRPDFATPQAALANLKEKLAELDPLNARLLLALVAGASKATSA
jgi:hypothetical protein